MVQCFFQVGTFEEWLRARAIALAMEVEPCTLAELAPDWQVGAALARPDGAFFKGSGLRVVRAAGREVPHWRQLIISDDEGGTVALVVCGDWGLVRAKAEPGNRGIEVRNRNTHVLVSPPLQFSAGNLKRHHGGSPVPLAGICEDKRFPVRWEGDPQDGGRFLDKTNRVGIVTVPSLDSLDVDMITLGAGAEDFVWVSRSVLVDIRRSGLANCHLRSVISMLV